MVLGEITLLSIRFWEKRELFQLLFSSTYKQHKCRKTKLTDRKMESSFAQLERNFVVNFEPPEKAAETSSGRTALVKGTWAFLLKHLKPRAGGDVLNDVFSDCKETIIVLWIL